MNLTPIVDITTPTRQRPVRVIVADDCAETRLLLRATLERAGCSVVGEAVDGLTAVDMACEQQPDVVVLDYLMPQRSGLEAIPAIRGGSPHSKILVLSAMTEDQVHDGMAHSAPDAWLPKGTATQELTSTIVRLAGVDDDPEWDRDDLLEVLVGSPGENQDENESWAAQALAETRATFDDTFDAAAISMALLTTGGRFIRVNPAYEQMAGRQPGELTDVTWLETLDLSDAARAMSAIGQLLDGQLDRYEARVHIRRPDGRNLWGDLRLSVVRNGAGLPVTLLAQIEDVTARLEAEARLASAFADAAIPTALVSPDGRYVQVNRALSEMLGRPESDLVGAAWTDFIHPADAEVGLARVLSTDGAGATLEKRYVRPDGTVRWGALTTSPVVDGDGHPLHDVVQIQDITERKEAQALLHRQATHDALTGLPNRMLLTDRLGVALARLARSSCSVAVMFCDLDRFKTINDSLGHAAGDRLLVEVSERLQDAVRPSDTIARFGGDEFVIMCDGLTYPRDAEAIAERMRAALASPIVIEGTVVNVSVSIGIALAYGASHTPEELLRKADTAMYQAKDQGRSRSILYEEAMGAWARSRLETEQDLRRAVAAGELVVHYQPVIDFGTRQVVSLEALVRWQHPEKGLLGAPDFVPLAEETGVIIPIGRMVIQEACQQAQRWRVAYPDLDLAMAVNLSAPEIAQPGLCDFVEETLNESGLPANRLCVEITETALVGAGRSAKRALDQLKLLGLRIAIDDFGTGYSSLAYLQKLPVDVIKIDRSFIEGFSGAGTSEAIVGAIIRLAEALELTTVAEGVEERDQETSLVGLQCTAGQGFLYGRPGAPDVVEGLLEGVLEGSVPDA